MPELVPDEPEPVAGLEVIARRRLAVARSAAGEEVRSRVPDRGRGRDDRAGEVEPGGERYKARAAASNASKSGTSEPA